MTAGELATLWTIRAALACYFAALTAQTAGHRESSQSLGRLFWTAGCLVYLAHVACAFHYYHGWSHAAAWRHTAGVTQQVIGWDWGGGLLVNYLFSAVWLGDAAWWWIRPAGRRARPAVISLAIYGFMLFVVVNATVVFETGALRWLALAASLLLAACWLGGRRKAASLASRRQEGSTPSPTPGRQDAYPTPGATAGRQDAYPTPGAVSDPR